MKTESTQFPFLLDRPGTRKEIAERIVRWHFHLSDDEKLSKMHGHGTLADAIEAALDAERERAAKILDARADQLQSEWDMPACAENGFIAMIADTPTGYATYWGMNNLRKLANQIRGNEMKQSDKVQYGDCKEWIERNANHTCAKQVKANRRRHSRK